MKLKDLLKEIYTVRLTKFNTVDNGNLYELNKDHLTMFKEMLLDCEEFRDVDDLIIPNHSVLLMGSHNAINSISLKLCDGVRFINRCYLHSITLTPPLYDPNKMNKFVKNNAMVTPTIYDPENFTPYKEIRLKWSPELAQDVFNIPEEENNLRRDLHDVLDDILDNMNDYQIRPVRGVIVKGVFEYIKPREENEYFIEL